MHKNQKFVLTVLLAMGQTLFALTATSCKNEVNKKSTTNKEYLKSGGTNSTCDENSNESNCLSQGVIAPSTTTPTTTTTLAPVISYIGVTKPSFIEGESITFTWATKNATRITLNGVDVTNKTQYDMTPPTNAPTKYTLTAYNGTQSTSIERTVNPVPLMTGKGITMNLAKNCVPAADDYMETMTYVNRRIEPADCSVVKLGKPIFSWVKPIFDMNPALPVNFILFRKSDNVAIYMKETTGSRLFYPSVLEAGQYYWKIKYTTKTGSIVLSDPRTFEIPANNQYAIISGYNLAQTMLAKPHPHALPRGKTFADIAAAMPNTEYANSYANFIRRANTIYTENKIPAIPPNIKASQYPPNSQVYADELVKLKNIAIDEFLAIETLGYAAKFTNNLAYQNKAIERLAKLAQWPYDNDSATSELQQDQANREIYLALATGLDLFSPNMTSAQRTLIISSMKARILQATNKYPDLDRTPYQSHLLTSTQYVTQALMLAIGTPGFPEAESMLISVWDTLITTSGTWGGRDGGYANGTSYGWFSTTSGAYLVAAVKLMADINLTQWEAFGNLGLNQIHFTAPNILLRSPFGDELEAENNYSSYSRDGFRLLAMVSGKKEYEWYWRKNPNNVTYTGYFRPQHYLVAGSLAEQPVGPGDTFNIPSSKIFEDAGYVAIHSRGNDSLRSSLFFRSSRFGSYNHSHADNNSFSFVSKGKAILISGGYYPSYNTLHHAYVGRATRFKNALTFNGGIGQAEPGIDVKAPGKPEIDRMDATGKLINFADGTNWAVTTGDATQAYRSVNTSTGVWSPLLTSAIRTVAYHRSEKVAIIYDYATSAVDRVWELNFNSMNAVTMLNNNKTVRIDNAPSSSCLEIYSNHTGTFIRTSGFPYAPEKPRPTQYQTQFKANIGSKKFVSVTVIRENCTAKAVNVKFFDTKAIIDINGNFIVADKQNVQAN